MNGVEVKGTWRLWSGVIAVFIVGVIIGGLSATVLMRSHLQHVMRSGPPRAHERVAERLTGGLDLTAAQREQIERIVHEFGPRFDEFEWQSRTEIRNLATEMETQIRAVLTPEQQAKYDAHIARMHEEFKRREHEGHRGEPPKE